MKLLVSVAPDTGRAPTAEDRQRATHFVNALLAGAFDAGWKFNEAVVVDADPLGPLVDGAHLDKRATLVESRPRGFFRLAGLVHEPAAVFLLGGRSRDGGAALDPLGGVLHEVRLGGTAMGPVGWHAALAGAHGVAIALVAGDAGLCAEAAHSAPRSRHVELSRAVSGGVSHQHPARADEALRLAAADAVRGRGELHPPLLGLPLKVELDVRHSAIADLASYLPFLERKGGTTLAFEAPDMVFAHRTLLSVCLLGRAANASV
jgi:D-amino peptidase